MNDLVPKGFYFGKHHAIGTIEYMIRSTSQTDTDIISFGLQTLSTSAQIFRLECDPNLYSLEYEIVRFFFISLTLMMDSFYRFENDHILNYIWEEKNLKFMQVLLM